jgi:hypothetical protein
VVPTRALPYAWFRRLGCAEGCVPFGAGARAGWPGRAASRRGGLRRRARTDGSACGRQRCRRGRSAYPPAVLRGVLDLLLPPRCPACGELVGAAVWCGPCRAELAALALPDQGREALADDVLAVGAYAYDGVVRDTILAVKAHGHHEALRGMGALLRHDSGCRARSGGSPSPGCRRRGAPAGSAASTSRGCSPGRRPSRCCAAPVTTAIRRPAAPASGGPRRPAPSPRGQRLRRRSSSSTTSARRAGRRSRRRRPCGPAGPGASSSPPSPSPARTPGRPWPLSRRGRPRAGAAVRGGRGRSSSPPLARTAGRPSRRGPTGCAGAAGTSGGGRTRAACR